ncbi:MAG: hypothetical protein ACKVS6_03540 [Planctomycetota bacterium]
MRKLSILTLLPTLLFAAPQAPGRASQPASTPQSRSAFSEVDLIQELVKKHKLTENLERYKNAVGQIIDQSKGSRYLTKTRELFANPFALPEFAGSLTENLMIAARLPETSISGIVRIGSKLVDADIAANIAKDLDPRPVITIPPDVEANLASIELRIVDASIDVQDALSTLSGEEQKLLRSGLDPLFQHFVSNIYIHQSPALVETWKLAERINYAAMFRAAARLAPLASAQFLKNISDNLRKKIALPAPIHVAGVSGTLLFAKQTPSGWILVGDAGPNRYEVAAALIIDLGGNDIYSAQATRSDLGRPVNVVLDLGGDDRYQSEEMYSQACGLLGVSFIIDQSGKDNYSAGRVAQGASAAGVGILVDRAGDDLYEGDAFVQGAGCFGIGCLLDVSGNDMMNAKIDSQGYAWPISAGFLIDINGNDKRTATGAYGSTYGTPGEFAGRSMGASFGFRFLACGGFGVLLDGAGDDITKVGEMGFGMGYYFGCGFVRDLGGNDQVFASRYGIAAAAHQALSIVIDDKGNDLWDNAHTASIAGNWDTTYSFFIDLNGNDTYRGAGISTGGATISSLAAFIDGGGIDRYETTDGPSFGSAGHPEDAQRNTQSIAFFLDLGGNKDQYPGSGHTPPLSNNSEFVSRKSDVYQTKNVESGAGIFLDR